MLSHLTGTEDVCFIKFDLPERKTWRELPEPIQLIVRDLGQSAEADLARDTFAALIELLRELKGGEFRDTRQGAVEESVAAFSMMQGQVLQLVSRIEAQLSTWDEASRIPSSELRDVSFALRSELRGVFEREIAETGRGRQSEFNRERVAHAHGVLKNCFRQCVMTLARAFDPSLSEGDVFADAASRREESIALRDALSLLITSVAVATKKRFPQSAVSVIEHLDVFRRDSMPYLMRRDWELFDRFENDIVASQRPDEFNVAVKKLQAGLETLIEQVNMRAVLIDGARAPFRPVSLHLRLWRALDGRRPALWSVAASSVVLACGLAFFVDLPVKIQGSQSRPEPNRASVESAPVSHTTEPSKLKTPPVVAPETATAAAAAAAPRQTVAPKASEPLHNVVAPTTPDDELTLQVAAFRVHATALASAAKLNSQGFEARVSEAKKGGQLIFLVHVGRFASREEAESFGRQLRARKIATSFIIASAG